MYTISGLCIHLFLDVYKLDYLWKQNSPRVEAVCGRNVFLPSLMPKQSRNQVFAVGRNLRLFLDISYGEELHLFLDLQSWARLPHTPVTLVACK